MRCERGDEIELILEMRTRLIIYKFLNHLIYGND